MTEKFIRTLAVVALIMYLLIPGALAVGDASFRIVEMRQSGDIITMYLTRFLGDWNVDNRTYSAGQYSVKMDGEEYALQSAQSLREIEGSIHYILLVDVSKSIRSTQSGGNPSERNAINEALKRFYENLEDNECVTLIPFGNTGSAIEVREGKRSELLRQPELRFDGDYTHMFEAIVTGADVYLNNRDRYDRTAMIMITDGTDDYTNNNASHNNADHYSYADASEKMSNAVVPFYALMFRRDDKPGNQSDVTRMAEQCNGSALVTDTAHISEKLRGLQSITRNSSVLTIALTQDAEVSKTQLLPSDFIVQTSDGETTPARTFKVDWARVTAVRTPEDLYLDGLSVSAVTEDDSQILVLTEPEAEVAFVYNNQTLYMGNADENGELIWDYSGSGSGHLKAGIAISVYARDQSGNTQLPNQRGSDPGNPVVVTVGESSLAPIIVSYPEQVVKNNYEYSGDPLVVNVQGAPGQQIEVTWAADGIQSKSFSYPLQNNGALTLRLNFEEINGTGVSDVTGGNLVIQYANGLGLSRTGATPGSLTWHKAGIPAKNESVAAPTIHSRLNEDSAAWTMSAAPGTAVTVQWSEGQSDTLTASEDGSVRFEVPGGLKKGREILVSAADESGNRSETVSVIVEESLREPIIINDIATPIVDSRLKITGKAEKNETVLITWTPESNSENQTGRQVQTNAQGIFTGELSEDECELGRGYITVSYADGHSVSRQAQIPTVVEWPGAPKATPTPTPAPMPTKAERPTAPPTPTPAPEPAPGSLQPWLIPAIAGTLVLLILLIALLALRRKNDGNDDGGVKPTDKDGPGDHGNSFNHDEKGTVRGKLDPGDTVSFPGNGNETIGASDSPAPMRLYIQEFIGNGRSVREHKYTFERSPGAIVIGRRESCEVCLSDENTVSREHLRLERDGNRLYVTNLSQKNGTKVNGRLIQNRTLLKNDDELTLGKTTLRISVNPPARSNGRKSNQSSGDTVFIG